MEHASHAVVPPSVLLLDLGETLEHAGVALPNVVKALTVISGFRLSSGESLPMGLVSDDRMAGPDVELDWIEPWHPRQVRRRWFGFRLSSIESMAAAQNGEARISAMVDTGRDEPAPLGGAMMLDASGDVAPVVINGPRWMPARMRSATCGSSKIGKGSNRLERTFQRNKCAEASFAPQRFQLKPASTPTWEVWYERTF